MKRTLSLVLALVMILGTFTTVFAATEAEKTAAEFLADEGILKGADGDLMLDKNLERRDAVVLLSRLLGVEEEAAEFLTTEDSPSWEDARTDAYYVPFFAWAQENGYFEGDDEGNFNPRNAITAPEYSLVLLRALGYEVNGHESWKASLETAEKIGLLKDVEVEFADLVVRGQMAAMTFNALGTKMNGSDETLAEFLGIEMPEAPKADKLTVEVLETENLAEVVVELSNADLIKDKEALTNPNNYRISETGVVVKHVDVVGDDVILTLVPYGEVEDAEDFKSLIKGKKFNLTIRNIHPDMNGTYRNILANDNAIPAVESVDFMGDYGIKVTTTEPIANPLERNFRLDSRTSMIVEQYGREIILTPYHNVSFDKDADQLTVDKLEDFARYTSATTFEELELSSDDALPQVEAAYRSGDKLTVVFDRDVYHDSIEAYTNRRESGNVSFVERRVTFYAETAEKVDTNVVVYTFEREIPRNIEVEISGVANHFDKAMETEVVVPVEYKDEYAPVIVSHTEKVKITDTDNSRINDLVAGLVKAKDIDARLDEKTDDVVNRIVDTQSMTITFDKDIAELVEFNSVNGKITEEDLVDHFILYELDVTNRGKVSKEEVQIKVVADSVKKDEIKLTFEGIKVNNSTRDFDYVLEVRDFTDLNRNRMEREYLDFQVIRIADAFSAQLVSILPETYYNRNGVEITLKFNAPVNKEEASNHRNYYLDGKLVIDEAIVERDGKTVSLLIYDKTVAKVYEDYKVLELSPRIVDLSSPAVKPAYRFFNLETKAAMPEVKPGTPVEEVPVVVEALENKIAEVEALALVEAEYTAETWEALQTALTAANVVLANEEATQEEVNAAVAALEAAVEALVDAEEEPVDPEEVVVTATKGSSLMGLTNYTIELEGADVEDITDVLVNGNSKFATKSIEDGIFSFRSDEIAETIEVVVNEVTVEATIIQE